MLGPVMALAAVLMAVGSVNGEVEKKPAFRQMKASIVKKNIFEPALTAPAGLPGDVEEPMLRELGPRRLQRPFRVIAFDSKGGEVQARLRFDNPPGDGVVKEGDALESIVILKISPPYMWVNYAGQEVRIAVDETSNDAYDRLRRTRGSDYKLLGTTIGPEGSFARFSFPGGREHLVEEGEVLGNSRVIKISWGEVELQSLDGGEPFTVKTSTSPEL